MIYIIVFNIIFIGWTNILGFQVLVVRDKNREFMLSTTIPAVVSVAINIVVIPFLGYIGASITALIVEFLVFAIQWYYSRNLIKKDLLFNVTLLKIVGAALLMFGIIMLLKSTLNLEGILALAIYVAVGGAFYLARIILSRAVNIKEIKLMLKQ